MLSRVCCRYRFDGVAGAALCAVVEYAADDVSGMQSWRDQGERDSIVHKRLRARRPSHQIHIGRAEQAQRTEA
jgi:hypothetical protein